VRAKVCIYASKGMFFLRNRQLFVQKILVEQPDLLFLQVTNAILVCC